MGVIKGDGKSAYDIFMVDIEGGDECFYCGKTLEPPAVVWMGSTSTILLHPHCVLNLTIRLTRDVHQIQCGNGMDSGEVGDAADPDFSNAVARRKARDDETAEGMARTRVRKGKERHG